MGRNQYGGNKQKSMANKVVEVPMRYASSHLELYAKVTKACGNGMFQLEDNNANIYIGHVRGKMRGKSKRNNLVKLNDILLIGLREWESLKKNADILYIYEENQVQLLSDNARHPTDRLIERSDIITYDYNDSDNTKTKSHEKEEVVVINFDDTECEIDIENI
jgi:initiation factor 1A